MWKLTALGMVGALACTSRNPRACDTDLPCPDPAMPFCDLDGVVSGTPYSCVAVDCTPGAFVACNEDRAVQCNAVGDNYDTVVCERGCDPASDGCRLCNPGETACTNGVVATCDAAGAVVAQEACPLGCFEAEPRCRDIDPSNGLGAALDQADTAPVLDLSAGGSIDATTGQVFGVGGLILIPSVLLPAPAEGAAIRVLVVKSAILGQVSVVTSGPTPPALAIVSDGDIELRNALASVPDAGGYLPAGGITAGPCVGQNGNYSAPQGVGDEDMSSGGGGGGGATAGGDGGTIVNGIPFGPGGAAYPNEDLVPLRGGCPGGGLLGYPPVSNGGSAVQLVSRTRIELAAGASIDMRAWIADQAGADPPCFGGGSGGNVLLEAPTVVLGQGAKVLTNGAPGILRSGGVRTSDDGNPTPGTPCPNPLPAGMRCGPGGQGAAAQGGPTDGGSIQYTSGLTLLMTGGGGGALGYLRINTADGTYTKASDVLESASTSAGTLQTR